MTQTTLKTLFEREVLMPGDTLVMNKQRLRAETPVSKTVIRNRNETDFWRCRITPDSRETHQVRYLYDDGRYGLASLATHIVERLVENAAYVNITSQENYWRHTAFENRTLWDLTISHVQPDRRPRDV